MVYPWVKLDSRPDLPEDLPLPPVELSYQPEWHECEAEDGNRLVVTFTGTGQPPELIMGFLYSIPPDGASWRSPTFEELYDASGLCHLEGCMYELPPWQAGREMPEEAVGILINFRQMGAVQGTPAEQRFKLSAGGIVMVPGPARA